MTLTVFLRTKVSQCSIIIHPKGYLAGLREWDEDSYALTEIILEAQERFSRQVALQDLGEHRLEELDDDEEW